MPKPTTEDIKKGYVNARGGRRRPDHEIDLEDIPELSPDAKTIHRGPMSEFLKRRRDQLKLSHPAKP
jgi:hypothetical protein